MPDLVSIATRRPVDLGSSDGKKHEARFAAIDYVNKLTIAPNGSRITSTEKNVLQALAQWHNAELGVAWPSMRHLAQRCSVSERHCRRTISRLERKGVITRVYMRRSDHGSQTSNEYFFPALGVPVQTEQRKQARLQLQKVPRTQMALAVGQKSPSEVVRSVHPTRSSASGPPGHHRPPIESLQEIVTDSLREAGGRVFNALAATRAKIQVVSFETEVPNRTGNALDNVGIARMAWESALQRVREVHGARQFRSYNFQDVRVSAVRTNSDASVTVELRSQNPEKIISGIQRYRETIARALRRYYGCEVKLGCLGDAEGAV